MDRKKKKAFPFSPGFMDKIQWEVLMNLSRDPTVRSIGNY